MPRSSRLLPRALTASVAILALCTVANPCAAAEHAGEHPVLSSTGLAGDPLAVPLGVRSVMPLALEDLVQWKELLARHAASLAAPAPCPDTAPHACFASFWRETVAALMPLPRSEQLRRVNELVNRLSYAPDSSLYAQADHWATPEEMFHRGAGDCEDFAAFKYFLLRAVGIPDDQVRLDMVSHDDQPHMLTLVMVGDAAVLLDNIELEPAAPSEWPQYRPVYSLSERGGWLLAPARNAPDKIQLSAR